MDVFTRSLTSGFTSSVITVPNYPKELAQAVQDQNKIGSEKMLQGFIATTWQKALNKCGVKRDKTANTMTFIFKQIWNVLFQRLWDTRNHILHHTPNCYRIAEANSLDSKLQWYSDNRFRLFPHADADLADFDRTLGNLEGGDVY